MFDFTTHDTNQALLLSESEESEANIEPPQGEEYVGKRYEDFMLQMKVSNALLKLLDTRVLGRTVIAKNPPM